MPEEPSPPETTAHAPAEFIGTSTPETDPPPELAESTIGLTTALNDFASVQTQQIQALNNQIASLTAAINLVRSYTPEGFESAGTTAVTSQIQSLAATAAALKAAGLPGITAIITQIQSLAAATATLKSSEPTEITAVTSQIQSLATAAATLNAKQGS